MRASVACLARCAHLSSCVANVRARLLSPAFLTPFFAAPRLWSRMPLRAAPVVTHAFTCGARPLRVVPGLWARVVPGLYAWCAAFGHAWCPATTRKGMRQGVAHAWCPATSPRVPHLDLKNARMHVCVHAHYITVDVFKCSVACLRASVAGCRLPVAAVAPPARERGKHTRHTSRV